MASTSSRIELLLAPVYQRASRMMSFMTLLLMVASIALAPFHDRWIAALAIGLPTTATVILAATRWPTALVTRLLFATALMIFAALQIHLLNGLIEAHFVIFILLSLLLLYRDWRPVVTAAGVIAVHHLLMGFLQSRGAPIYVMPADHLNHLMAMVLVHAAYVVMEATMLVAMTRLMRREAIAASELSAMSTHIGRQDGHFDLGVEEQSMFSTLGESFRHTLQAVRNTLHQVVESVAALSGTGRDITTGNERLAERTRDQGQALARASATLDQLGQRVQDNLTSADAASERTRHAGALVEQGCERVAQLGEATRQMRESSGHITEITALIDSIAFQTNILALNASVEAARAGESGRGFAVVAQEVGTLAQKSAEASRQIAETIASTRQHMETSSARADEVTDTMGEIAEQTRRINALMDEIRHAGSEQRDSIGQISRDIAAIGEGTRENGALAEELRDDVGELQGQAQRLHEALGVFVLGSRGSPAAARNLSFEG
ncbi:methyl-accepting chemotaxis protein [Kushneria aurantia]|uniref:Methyl-accepting chemotaxis protein n=1 Tax=Kushneria aurantia TaxID=504092 RepID=A0ABV6G042_9GAMM|nr:methyl-accepting chemotaxis protein [Kushneria aurantia]